MRSAFDRGIAGAFGAGRTTKRLIGSPKIGAWILFIAMNRFRIADGREAVFEELWRKRDSRLEEVPGFEKFHLLRGPTEEGATLYASHTVWTSREAFEAWTNSEAFRKAHAQARAPEGTYLSHPVFEGFEIVM